LPALADVRETVKRDWVNAQRSETNEEFYQAHKLRDSLARLLQSPLERSKLEL